MERVQQQWAVSILFGANPKEFTAGIRNAAQMSAEEDLALEEGKGGSIYMYIREHGGDGAAHQASPTAGPAWCLTYGILNVWRWEMKSERENAQK